MKVFVVHGLCNGKYALAAHPRGNEHLDSEIKALKEHGFTLVVSMLTSEEQAELGLDCEGAVCRKLGLQYLNYPIRDEVAGSDIETLAFIDKLKRIEKPHKKVLFHCRGGVGRSSMMLALVSNCHGGDTKTVFNEIALARGESTPESAFQEQWVKLLSNSQVNHKTSGLEQHVVESEIALHRYEVRANKKMVERLLHPDFQEVGVSGNRYDYDSITSLMQDEKPDSFRIHAQDFECHELSPTILLLLYHSVHVTNDGVYSFFAKRSSIWQQNGSLWQMKYHQGTPCEPFKIKP